MKNLIAAVIVILLFTACSADPNSPTEESPTKFEVFLETSSLALAVDETAIVTVDSENPLKEVKWIREGGEKGHTAFDGSRLQEDLKLYFQFPFPGNYPVTLEFTDIDGKSLTKVMNFDVSRGNTVQITGIEVKNFYDQGKAWDPEADEENKLADLVLALVKRQHTGFATDRYSSGIWYISDIHENESSLDWDLSEKQLYLDPRFGFSFALEDRDEGGISQNLMLNRPTYDLDLLHRIQERPTTVSLIDEEVNLHVIFHLDWP